MGDVYDCSPCSDSTSINKKRERRRLFHFLLKDNVFNGPERERNTFFSGASVFFCTSAFCQFWKGQEVFFWGYRKVFWCKTTLVAESSSKPGNGFHFRSWDRRLSIRYRIKTINCGLWPVKHTWFSSRVVHTSPARYIKKPFRDKMLTAPLAR